MMAGVGGHTVKGQLTPRIEQNLPEILSTLAICNGNANEASRRLRIAGIPVHTSTIGRLRDRYADVYQQRRQELAPQIEETFAADLLENAAEATAMVKRLIDETGKRLDEGSIEEPARAARELSQVTQQSIDKRLAVQGRPTQIVESRNIAEIIKTLEGKRILEVIESTAIEEEPDDRDRANP